MSQPLWCKCGKPVTFSNESRCEDCYADDAERIGRSPHVDVQHKSQREIEAQEARSNQVRAWFAQGKSK